MEALRTIVHVPDFRSFLVGNGFMNRVYDGQSGMKSVNKWPFVVRVLLPWFTWFKKSTVIFHLSSSLGTRTGSGIISHKGQKMNVGSRAESLTKSCAGLCMSRYSYTRNIGFKKNLLVICDTTGDEWDLPCSDIKCIFSGYVI